MSVTDIVFVSVCESDSVQTGLVAGLAAAGPDCQYLASPRPGTITHTASDARPGLARSGTWEDVSDSWESSLQ